MAVSKYRTKMFTLTIFFTFSQAYMGVGHDEVNFSNKFSFVEVLASEKCVQDRSNSWQSDMLCLHVWQIFFELETEMWGFLLKWSFLYQWLYVNLRNGASR